VGETDQNRDINTYDALGRFILTSNITHVVGLK